MKRIYLYTVSMYERLRAKCLTYLKKEVRKEAKKAGAPASPVQSLVKQLEVFLAATYEFRFNQVCEVTEYRRKRSAENFLILGEREENSLCMEAHRLGIPCWDRDVRRYVRSLEIPAFHPFRQYIDGLPQWDGCDRVEALARRVSSDPLWINGFHRWLRAMTAQWMGMDELHGNSVSPILISQRQGRHKSTFCKLLLPDALAAYYTDHYDLNSEGGAVQKLATFGLINLDEFDKYSDKKMTLLKNLMQMSSVNIRKAHRKNYATLPRIASFIATSNRTDLLTDPTGSRRFLCIEVNQKIDVSPIDHAQLYAQLKAELLAGKLHWFTTDEETAIIRHNRSFQKTGPDTDLFHQHYRIPAKGSHETTGVEWLSAASIYENLRKLHPTTMRQTTASHFGKTLIALGVERKHTSQGNLYRVVVIGK